MAEQDTLIEAAVKHISEHQIQEGFSDVQNQIVALLKKVDPIDAVQICNLALSTTIRRLAGKSAAHKDKLYALVDKIDRIHQEL